jgi:hypothetical protein
VYIVAIDAKAYVAAVVAATTIDIILLKLLHSIQLLLKPYLSVSTVRLSKHTHL